MFKIILASQSPRRKQLLQWAEVNFEVNVQHSNEDYDPNLSPSEIAVCIATNKALAVKPFYKDLSETIIIAADTIVVLNNEVIGKPNNRQHAISILQKLSENTHQVITGVVLLSANTSVEFADITEVEFHEISTEQIEFYVDKYRPYDKAGAYAIQEWIGVVGIKSIKGDFYNVMGLPVSRVIREMNKLQQAIH